MSDCAYMPNCAFYYDRLAKMPATAEFMKMVFCHQRSDQCERFKSLDLFAISDPMNLLIPVNTRKSDNYLQADQSGQEKLSSGKSSGRASDGQVNVTDMADRKVRPED